jgi:uncharacterized protein (DUF1330 family)
MTAYYIASPEEVSDPDGMKEYATNSEPVLNSFGGRYLVHRNVARQLSGSWDPKYIVLIEFPSMERLLEWYESEEYRPWRELRERSAKASIVVTEG